MTIPVLLLRVCVDEFVDSFKEVNAMKVFRSVSLCIGLGFLSWASSLSAHEASKINANSLLREYFRNETLSYSSQVENRCGRIGLNAGNVDQIMVEEQAPLGFERGISSFVEKKQLDPFAQTKFLGHNAVHAWLGYLAENEGLLLMSEVGKRDDLMRRALDVFQREVGPGLIHAHVRSGDPLFTSEGINAYAKDALKRMVNPFLNDPIERVTRDPIRKLGWEDRLIGSMRLVIEAGIKPELLAEGARLALARASKESQSSPQKILNHIWSQQVPKEEKEKIFPLLLS